MVWDFTNYCFKHGYRAYNTVPITLFRLESTTEKSEFLTCKQKIKKFFTKSDFSSSWTGGFLATRALPSVLLSLRQKEMGCLLLQSGDTFI